MAEASQPSIDVRALRKNFGTFEAVRDVTFSVRPGEVLGFLGPNGAGKSTTMKMITGYVPASSGEIRICGDDIQLHPLRSKGRIGYLPEGSPLYGDMSVMGLLRFTARVRGLSGVTVHERIGSVVDVLELSSVLYQRINTLSKGFKRRVGLAEAIVADPPVLILDEPTDGLDPNQKHQVRTLIRELGKEKAIIISTHLLEEVDAVCDRAIIIDRGRMVFEGTPEALHSTSLDYNTVTVRVRKDDAAKAEAALAALAEVQAVSVFPEEDSAMLHARPAGRRSIADAVGAALRGSDVDVIEMRIETGRLDDVFRQVTGQVDGERARA